MNKLKLIIVALIFSALSSFSQDSTSYVLSGTIVDGTNNVLLIGANLLTSRKIGTKTNENGDFEIIIYQKDTLKISYIGFKTIKYIAPQKDKGKYLIKFKMYKDSISLEEVEVFPWPTYKEFKKAFLTLNKESEQVKMKGVNMYTDKSRTAPAPSVLNPASFIYDRLFDKKSKMRRRLTRRRKTIKRGKSFDD